MLSVVSTIAPASKNSVDPRIVEPLFQIISGIGMLLGGVLNLLGNLVSAKILADGNH